ncbi:uncharacterized protein [Gossypium hirsutum]|uniref:Retrotransposon gag domain-containing protein n=1 Tax=Gossypium hirsutum TaxID=3635 RepID=A0ABM3BJA2_GOSHI|nr:uncharacterized protein LOC121228064 [Gossypium hirsutum]
MVPHEKVTWEFFQEEFWKKYISERFMDQKRKEFLDLKQGRMMVTEYEREFVRPSKYAWECVSSEAKMCRRFEDGLNKDIRLSVGVLELKEFMKIEAETRDARKRHASKSFPSQSKKSRDVYSRFHASVEHSHRDCKKMNDGFYFRCGSQDHFIKDYPEITNKEKFQGTRPSGTNSKERPQKNVGAGAGSMNVTKDTTVRSEARTPARTYAIRVRENASSLDMITGESGNLPIVISAMSAQKCFRMNDGFYFRCGSQDHFIKDYPEITNKEKFQGTRPSGTNSKERPQKNVGAGAGSMNVTKDTTVRSEARTPARTYAIRESKLKVESVPIVSEYVDVFQEELPGLPPNREVKFGIELIPGTTPISIALYRMAPTDLKELKSQL